MLIGAHTSVGDSADGFYYNFLKVQSVRLDRGALSGKFEIILDGNKCLDAVLQNTSTVYAALINAERSGYQALSNLRWRYRILGDSFPSRNICRSFPTRSVVYDRYSQRRQGGERYYSFRQRYAFCPPFLVPNLAASGLRGQCWAY